MITLENKDLKSNIEIKDEQEAKGEMKLNSYKVDFKGIANAIKLDLVGNKNLNVIFKTYSKGKVSVMMENPEKHEEQFRSLSKFLYVASTTYRRLCNYYSEIAYLYWYIEPFRLNIEKVNISAFKKAYSNILNSMDNMNIEHEFSKIMKIVYIEGIFFGYEHSSTESYFIQKLNPKYCVIKSIEDGVFNFAFDFSYFTGNELALNGYSEEFKSRYKKYKNASSKEKSNYRYQELNSNKTICIKLDETISSTLPPFIGVILDIYDIQDYKTLKKINQEMQNTAMLIGKIPYLSNKNDMANAFALDLEMAVEYGNRINRELPDQFGFLLSLYEDVQMFKLGDDKSKSDKVQESINNFWDISGVSKTLFSESGGTEASIKMSIKTEEQSVFKLLLQIERWINRKIKKMNNKYKFRIHMLPITTFNADDFIAKELKVAQFGIPNKTRLATALGLTQSGMSNMAFLENTILELPSAWIPLQSTHTMSNTVDNTESVVEEISEAENGGDED